MFFLPILIMNHFSLFSGIGGFDLASQWMGWNNVGHCEIDPFCQKVLRFHFPSSHQYGDIRQLDGTKYRGQIDVLSGGFPCQPFSTAGRRRGTEDNRFLWPEMLRVIREMQPTWIVAENVRGIVSIDGGMVFERVCSELEANGYEVQPLCIPACAVGAPHRRERIWFVAHLCRERRQQDSSSTPGNEGADGRGKEINQFATGQDKKSTSNAEGTECQLSGDTRELRTGFADGCVDATDSRCERWGEGASEGMEPPSQEPKRKDTCNSHWTRESWLQAATRLCRVDDGLPAGLDGITVPRWRKESLRAFGNAIVPQVAFQIFQAITQ